MRMPFIGVKKKGGTLGKKDGFGGNDVFYVYTEIESHRCLEL